MTNDSFVSARGHSRTPLTRRGSPWPAAAVSGAASTSRHARTNRHDVMAEPPARGAPQARCHGHISWENISPHRIARFLDDVIRGAFPWSGSVVHRPTARRAPFDMGSHR